MNKVDIETIDRLEEIKEEMLDLIAECEGLVRGTPEQLSAESYWIAHITCALTNDHGYLGGSVTTMEDTIECLRNPEE